MVEKHQVMILNFFVINLGLKYIKEKLSEVGYKTYLVPEAATITIFGGGEIIPHGITENTQVTNLVHLFYLNLIIFEMNMTKF